MFSNVRITDVRPNVRIAVPVGGLPANADWDAGFMKKYFGELVRRDPLNTLAQYQHTLKQVSPDLYNHRLMAWAGHLINPEEEGLWVAATANGSAASMMLHRGLARHTGDQIVITPTLSVRPGEQFATGQQAPLPERPQAIGYDIGATNQFMLGLLSLVDSNLTGKI